jgi:hypothetical protein
MKGSEWEAGINGPDPVIGPHFLEYSRRVSVESQ